MKGRFSESRVLARVTLVVVLISTATLLFMTGTPSASFMLAQSSPTPSGSATPSATSTEGSPVAFEINFLNPSRFSEEISTRDEGGGDEAANTYHLVAWVNALPSDANVEFRYRINGRSEETLIGEATPVLPGDTFEFLWEDIPDEIPEGEETFELYAILYSGDTEVARDTEDDLLMNNTGPPDDDEEDGSTIELTYPVNGGAFGIFERQDRPTQAMIDTVRSVGSTESNVLESDVFYSISEPGSEPTWTFCGAEDGLDSGVPAEIRCSLSASHELEEVTAVAALAVDLSCEPFVILCAADEESGDAHRVLVYEQDPTTLTLTPDQQNERPATSTTSSGAVVEGACSAIITATLTDQNDRPIANAPIDIHAIGPSDNLRFDDSGNNTSSTQHPQQHTRQETENCEANPPTTSQNEPPGCPPCSHTASFQGEHNNPAGNDLKHLESTLGGGTSDLGTFLFQLWSPDRGETQITVFVDNESEDDLFCTDELSASASIGWEVPAPAPDGPDAEITSCPEPTPSPMASRSPTASPSESPTDDPRGCTIVGTDDSEAIVGTAGSDIICAGGGNDIINGLEGNDTIYGDGGADEIDGGADSDFVDGGQGKDTIRLGAGRDSARGAGQNDVMIGGGGVDQLFGNSGFDTIRGGPGPDTLRGGSGDDTIRGGRGRDFLYGNKGDDILHGDRGPDSCRGGPGKDRLRSCARA